MHKRTPFALCALAATLIATFPRTASPQTTAPDDRVTALIKQLADLESNNSSERYELARKTKDELKNLGTPAVAPLVDLVINNRPGYGYAREALLEMDPSIVPLLEKHWNDAPTDVARLHLLPIIEKHDPAVPLGLMRPWLTSKDIYRPGYAMDYLAKRHDQASKPAILAALNIETPQVRWSAVYALKRYGGDDVIAALIPLSKKTPGPPRAPFGPRIPTACPTTTPTVAMSSSESWRICTPTTPPRRSSASSAKKAKEKVTWARLSSPRWPT